jgi:hypothetical protein
MDGRERKKRSNRSMIVALAGGLLSTVLLSIGGIKWSSDIAEIINGFYYLIIKNYLSSLLLVDEDFRRDFIELCSVDLLGNVPPKSRFCRRDRWRLPL